MKKIKVQRLSDWDDARYSTVPPRASRDKRLTGTHFALLIELGRVNTRQGWCEFSQSETAKVLGMARQTLSIAMNELDGWGYVAKRSQKKTHSSFCHYRVLIDRPDEPADPEERVSPTADTPHAGGVSPTADTPCQPQVTQVSATGDTSHYIKKIIDHSPPPPQRGKRAGARERGREKRISLIEELRTEGCAPHVLDCFLGKMMIEGGLAVPPKWPDPHATLEQLCKEFSGEMIAVLESAAEAIKRDRDRDLPSPKGMREYVAKAHAKAAQRHAQQAADRQAAAQREAAANLKWFSRDTPEFAAVLERARGDNPAYARMIEKRAGIKLGPDDVARLGVGG